MTRHNVSKVILYMLYMCDCTCAAGVSGALGTKFTVDRYASLDTPGKSLRQSRLREDCEVFEDWMNWSCKDRSYLTVRLCMIIGMTILDCRATLVATLTERCIIHRCGSTLR